MEKTQYRDKTWIPTLFWYPKRSWIGDDETKKPQSKYNITFIYLEM